MVLRCQVLAWHASTVEADSSTPDSREPWQLAIDSDFGHSNVCKAKQTWEP